MPFASTARRTDPSNEADLPANLQIFDYEPAASDDLQAVLSWLNGQTLTPPARLLYDDQGAKFFEDICETPEYYLTQCEEALLPQLAEYLSCNARPNSQIVEYGSGNLRKIARLLDACPKIVAHVPIDVSKSHLIENARNLADAYPDRTFTAICADFFQRVSVPTTPKGINIEQNIGFFPGSTIGNMPSPIAAQLLSNARKTLGPGSLFALAIDRVKSPRILVDAYLDSKGASANFSLNLIDRINRDMEGTIDKSAFRYDALYNQEAEAIEMWWRVEASHKARVADQDIQFKAGQRFLVEISRKFTPQSAEDLAAAAGYTVSKLISTPDDWYSLAILKA